MSIDLYFENLPFLSFIKELEYDILFLEYYLAEGVESCPDL